MRDVSQQGPSAASRIPRPFHDRHLHATRTGAILSLARDSGPDRRFFGRLWGRHNQSQGAGASGAAGRSRRFASSLPGFGSVGVRILSVAHLESPGTFAVAWY